MRRGKPRRRPAIAAAIFVVALASLLAYAKSKGDAGGPYRLADDCPRGALVYAQASDLPALLRLWDGSRLKERYLASTNYKQLAEGHVALKLAERAEEFGDALGFTPDVRALAEGAERSAAVAVYDIGRMELVFVAPAGEEKATAARFFQSAENFEETELPDGTAYYSHDVEADRGRQKQKILFAYARGRFVVATSEKLMLRALANISGRSRADRLSDDPSFKTLSRALAPHLASVWVDQSRLNSDYYFKHYWAMSGPSALKGIRAGLFDFEMRGGSFVERREFLIEGGRANAAALSPRDAQELSASLPEGAAYTRLRVLSEGAPGASSLVTGALLDRAPRARGGAGSSRRLREEFDAIYEGRTDYSWDDDYSYLGEDYDVSIDDEPDSEEDRGAGGGGADDVDESSAARLERALERARPAAAAVAESPVVRDGPLFAEFRRLAVVRLGEPSGLDAKAFEESVASLAVGRLTAAGTSSDLKWSDAGGARRRRELELPMLGWKLCYALRGRDLFVSNDADFLDAALAGNVRTLDRRDGERFATDDLTMIRLDRKREAFDAVFDKLDARRVADYRAQRGETSGERGSSSEEFFSGNVASLLDAASPVTRVEIRRRATPGRLREEVELSTAGAAAGEERK